MAEIKHYRYDLIGADINYGVKKHPVQDMRDLGFHIIKGEPVPIADCWWFRTDTQPDEIPPYLHEMKEDFKFSDEW